jgi:hypothetical protein
MATNGFLPLTPGSSTLSGSSTPTGTGMGMGTRGACAGACPLPFFRRRGARPSPFADLESALVAYLRSAPSVAGPLTLGFGSGGFGVAPFGASQVKVYSASADPEAQAPYLVLSGYTETSPGVTPDDAPIEVVIVVHAATLDGVVTLATAVKAAVDVPASNPNSLGRPPLVWQGGVETTVWRNASTPRKNPGATRGGVYAYCETIAYQFWVGPED